MKHLWLVTGLIVLSATVGQAQTAKDTSLVMRAVTVQDQNQLRGRFGDAWEAGEVRDYAAQTCGQNGMKLIYFKPGNTDSKGRTEFAAVCK